MINFVKTAQEYLFNGRTASEMLTDDYDFEINDNFLSNDKNDKKTEEKTTQT